MSDFQNPGTGPEEDEELQGPARYLQPGEELRTCTPDIQIKKFRFDAYLTDRRLFLVDQNERKPGITAKEIPIDSVVDAFLEHSTAQEPILVLSIRTSDDDVRTMKMTFVHTGTDRAAESEEWLHLVREGYRTGKVAGEAIAEDSVVTRASTPPVQPAAAPATAPGVRSLSETMIFPPRHIPEPEAAPETPLQRLAEDSRPPSRSGAPGVRVPPEPPGASTTTPIQFCFHCGHRVPPNANFCPYCGTHLGHDSHAVMEAPVRDSGRDRGQAQHQAVRDEQKKKKKGWGWIFRRG